MWLLLSRNLVEAAERDGRRSWLAKLPVTVRARQQRWSLASASRPARRPDRREPWLVIDPKPHVGDPTYDPVQHLLNCDERLGADPVGLTHPMADLLGLDRERLILWLFARCVQESADRPEVAEVARRVAPQ